MSGDDGPLDQGAIHALVAEVTALRAARRRDEARLVEILEMIQAIAELDYSRRAEVGDVEDPMSGVVAGLNMMAEELESSSARVHNVLSAMADAVFVIGRDGRVESANPAARRLLGDRVALGQPLAEALGGAGEALLATEILERFGGSGGAEVRLRRSDGGTIPVSLSAAPLVGASGDLEGAVCAARDISERLRAEEEQARLEREIRRQAATLMELSTPLVPIAAGVVALPLVGAVDAARAALVIEALLRGVGRHGARAVILDITGVPVVDSHVAAALLKAVSAVRLLGAETVLTGVRPEVAITLVTLELDLSTVITRSTLEAGIQYARRVATRSEAR